MIINNKLQVSFPLWAKELFNTNTYKILYGGRGSGKSYTVADYLILKSLQVKGTILCAREFQNSMVHSVHSLFEERINYWQLQDKFIVQRNKIICKASKTKFIFYGLSRNIGSIKSLNNIVCAWIEEGAYISKESWVALVPSIRGKDAEIIVIFNPLNKNDIIYKEFVINTPPKNAWVKKINYRDNPFFDYPLVGYRENDLELKSIDVYNHIWEGECLEHSDAQVFKNRWSIKSFEEPPKVHPYYGLDFGFSPSHPTAGIRCYIEEDNLYITHEVYAKGLLLKDIAKLLRLNLPDLDKYYIYADNARPDNIAHLKSVDSLKIKAVEKGKGSVEDGIEYIKNFNIIIHSRCNETIKEFTKYSYKIDARSGDIKREVLKENDNLVDALRYSLERLMKRKVIDYSKWRTENIEATSDYLIQPRNRYI